MDESQVRQIINANNEVLLKQMSDLISAHVASLKRPAEDSAESIIREIKKIKTVDTRPVFRKKSNEEQYKATTKILESLEDVSFNLESSNVEAAKASVDQGIKLVKDRQKLILLADKSLHGWKTVQEYLQHELADDSDDEKKIYRVEARAARNSRKFAALQRTSARATSIPSPHQSSQASLAIQSSPIPTNVTRGRSFNQSSLSYGVQKASPGSCFACGKMGHWRASCPFVHQPNNLAEGQRKQ